MLESRTWILADGATGTNLFNMGLPAGEAPELWNEQHPDRIKALYQGFANAGADLILTNSFGGNSARLKLHGAQGRAYELSRTAAELAREVADKVDRKIVVAGSIGPTGELIQPLGELTQKAAAEIFSEQAAGLIDGGADVLWVETMSALEEVNAAHEAISSLDKPWCMTMSFDTAGRTMMGVTERDLVDWATRCTHKPTAVGANCGLGAPDLLRTVLGLVDAGLNLPIIAKANAGIPRFRHGEIKYDASLDTMSEYATMARDCGAAIIGGCCGTTPTHLEAMRVSLELTAPGNRPGPEQITKALGEFSTQLSSRSSQSSTKDADRSRRGRRTRRIRSRSNSGVE